MKNRKGWNRSDPHKEVVMSDIPLGVWTETAMQAMIAEAMGEAKATGQHELDKIGEAIYNAAYKHFRGRVLVPGLQPFLWTDLDDDQRLAFWDMAEAARGVMDQRVADDDEDDQENEEQARSNEEEDRRRRLVVYRCAALQGLVSSGKVAAISDADFARMAEKLAHAMLKNEIEPVKP